MEDMALSHWCVAFIAKPTVLFPFACLYMISKPMHCVQCMLEYLENFVLPLVDFVRLPEKKHGLNAINFLLLRLVHLIERPH